MEISCDSKYCNVRRSYLNECNNFCKNMKGSIIYSGYSFPGSNGTGSDIGVGFIMILGSVSY